MLGGQNGIVVPNVLLFTAFFEDGLTIEQNEADVSLIYPEKNCLFEVYEKAKKVKLVSFVLAGHGYFIGVDFRDGHFEINQIPFHCHRHDLAPYSEFELYYARITQMQIEASENEQKVINGRVGGYELGWTVKLGDEEIKETITVYMD